MKKAFWARRAHKWIGLIVGVQALLWMIGGVYMTVIPLEIIHGGHLAHAHSAPLTATTRLPDAQVLAMYPGTTSLKLKHLLGREVYEVRQGNQTSLIDAGTGENLSPLDRDVVAELARQAYQGEAQVTGVAWIKKAPMEIGARHQVPLWAVHFADTNDTTLYFSPDTGELLARRHNLWRWFDFVWMLHIMDYDTRSDANNTLLRVASVLGLLFALSGAWLLLYSFRRRNAA